MQSQEQIRLKFCKKCINRKEDDRFGMLCGLTDQKPSFKYTCKDFKQGGRLNTSSTNTATTKEAYKPQPTYQKHNRKETKSKSPFWIGASILFTVVVIGLKIARSISRFDNNNNNSRQTEYNNDYLKQLQKAQQRKNRVNTINYLSAKNRPETFNRKMKTDTVIVLNPKLKLMLPRGFRLSISEDNKELPIKATSRGYYFICNKLSKNKKLDQLKQWEAYRNQLIEQYPNSKLIVRKPLTINTTTNDIDRIDFEIKNSSKTIIGTARIVDYKNDRYFLQLVSDASNADHTKINKYLRYYVKVK